MDAVIQENNVLQEEKKNQIESIQREIEFQGGPAVNNSAEPVINECDV